MTNTSKRIAWIDNVKLFAIVCVVISHCFHFFTQESYESLAIRPLMNAFNMHLFFFIAGMTSIEGILKIQNIHHLVKYFYKSVLRISVPCFCYSLITRIVGRVLAHESALLFIGVLLLFLCYAYFCLFKNRFKYARFTNQIVAVVLFVFTVTPYSGWFFQSFFINITTMAVLSFLSSKAIGVCGGGERKIRLIASLLSFVMVMFLLPIQSSTEMAFVYCLGAVFEQKTDIKCNYKKTMPFFVITIFFLFIGLLLFKYAYYSELPAHKVTFYETTFWDLLHMGKLQYYVLRQLCAISIGAFIIITIRMFSLEYNWISKKGSQTLPIYCIHGIILVVIAELHPIVNITNPIAHFFCSFSLASIILFLTITILYFIDHSDFLKLILTGDYREKYHKDR